MHGEGALTTQSGVFHDQPYSFKTRFQSEDGKAGTNPEELLGAAHAGCFAMALAFALTEAGHAPEHVAVTASVDLQKVEGGFAIANITLDLEAKVPRIDAAKFDAVAEGAKKDAHFEGARRDADHPEQEAPLSSSCYGARPRERLPVLLGLTPRRRASRCTVASTARFRVHRAEPPGRTSSRTSRS